jgi:hypothetical protein
MNWRTPAKMTVVAVALVSVLVVTFTFQTLTASAQGAQVIHLSSAPANLGYAGVKDNHNVSGQEIHTIGPGGHGILWDVVPTDGNEWHFVDAHDQRLCMGVDGTGDVVLRDCTNGTTLWWTSFRATSSTWVGNVGTGLVLSVGSDQNDYPLTLKPAGQSGQWQRWTF